MRTHPAYPYVIRILLAGVVVVLFFQLRVMWRTMHYGSGGTQDFIEYWSAGQLLLQGRNPYDPVELYRIQVSAGNQDEYPVLMWNPPWLLVWILPLLLIPFEAAALVWLLLNLVLLLLCATVIWRLLAPPAARPRIAVAWVAMLAFIPGLSVLLLGQMSTLMLVGVVGFLFCVERRNPLVAGMFLALTTIKPHLVYLLWIAVAWWVVSERQWKVALGAGVTVIISIGALAAISPECLGQYRSALLSPPLYWASPTIGTVLRALIFRNWPSAQYLPSAVGGILFTGYLLIKRPRFNWHTALSPLLLASVATAAYGWPFDHVVLQVPFLHIVGGILGDEPQTRAQKRLVVAALASIAAIMVIEIRLSVHYFFFLWVPWAFAAVYAYAKARRH